LQVGKRLAGTMAEKVTAYHVDGELGVNVAQDALRLALEGLYASGEDPTTSDLEGWNQLYPTAHKWLGLADIFGGRTDVISGVAHVAWKTTEKLTLKLDGHVFSRPEPAGGVEGYAGTEIDLVAGYGLGKGLSLSSLFAAFLPGEDYPVEDTAYFFELELRYTL
jgi:hypothetical protein